MRIVNVHPGSIDIPAAPNNLARDRRGTDDKRTPRVINKVTKKCQKLKLISNANCLFK